MRRAAWTFITIFWMQGSLFSSESNPWLDLPTENRALFGGNPEDFYMYVDRNFEGRLTKPWEGGSYGLVRGPRRGQEGIFFTTFHEGIDIRPVRRDSAGVPLDPVVAAADGVVVHASGDAGASNYGRYVVLEHRLHGSPYYTLYAHLATVEVEPGQRLKQGDRLGILGYTGAGLNRERAHLHFEFCFLLSENYEGWHALYTPGSPNRHGIFNGRNLNGINPAELLLAVHKNPGLTIPEHVKNSQKPLFAITVNESENFHLPRNYPWMVAEGEPSSPPAWSVVFSEEMIPMQIRAVPARVPEPAIEWLGAASPALSHQSRGLVTGSATAPRLTDSGKRFAHLLTFPDL
jgi:hypothetical protein